MWRVNSSNPHNCWDFLLFVYWFGLLKFFASPNTKGLATPFINWPIQAVMINREANQSLADVNLSLSWTLVNTAFVIIIFVLMCYGDDQQLISDWSTCDHQVVNMLSKNDQQHCNQYKPAVLLFNRMAVDITEQLKITIDHLLTIFGRLWKHTKYLTCFIFHNRFVEWIFFSLYYFVFMFPMVMTLVVFSFSILANYVKCRST